MKAIIFNMPGLADQLLLTSMNKPEIHAEEVLVQVKAISINPEDIKTRGGKGIYGRIKDQGPLILGWDISGIISESRSAQFKVGDEVFGMVNFPGHGRAYAEYVAAPADHLTLNPAGLSHEEAAASTLAALTAWQTMKHEADLQAGQKVLVHAAAGGVGHFAVQVGKYLGAQVTGTSSAGNKEFVLNLGADAHIDHSNYDWSSHPEAFDFILDTLGGDNVEKSLLVTKKGGTIISIPTGLNEDVTGKAKVKGVNAYFTLVKSSGSDMKVVADLLQQGILKAHVSQVYQFEDIAAAHLQIESGHTVGKIVLTV